jgi:hypothetical protein
VRVSSTEPSILDGLGQTDLEEERDFLLGSLTDLDAELAAGDIEEHDYLTLKDGYTSRAAAVLRLLAARTGDGGGAADHMPVESAAVGGDVVSTPTSEGGVLHTTPAAGGDVVSTPTSEGGVLHTTPSAGADGHGEPAAAGVADSTGNPVAAVGEVAADPGVGADSAKETPAADPSPPDSSAPESGSGSGPAGAAPTEAARRKKRARRRGILVASAVAVFAVVAGVLVTRGSGERLPGAATSGNIAETGPEADLQTAQADINNGDYLGAVKLYDQVLRTDPTNAEALAYSGWLLRLTGVASKDESLIDRGLTSVRAAESSDPKYPDAHFFAGEILLKDKNDGQGAISEFCLFLSNNPPASFVPLVDSELQSAIAVLKANPATANKAPACKPSPSALPPPSPNPVATPSAPTPTTG